MKTCVDCGQLKPADAFARQRAPESRGEERSADGCNAYCRPCGKRRESRRHYVANPGTYREYADRWRAENPEKRKEVARNYARKVRWGRFGVTPEQAAELIARANGRCESCNDELSDKIGITIDHCHVSSVVRGVLCAPCNKAEGFLKSDPERARRLADYLDRHGAGVVA